MSNELDFEQMIESWDRLKKSIPVNFTANNITRLKMVYRAYQILTSNLPDHLADIRRYCERNGTQIAADIETAANTLIAWRLAKRHFKMAAFCIKNDIDKVMALADKQLVK